MRCDAVAPRARLTACTSVARSYCDANELRRDTFECDALIDALEQYQDAAAKAAFDRAEKRAASGRPPRKNDRGDATATKPVYEGCLALKKKLGLPFEANEDVAEVARVGPGMPQVGTMHKLDHMRELERITCDSSRNVRRARDRTL